jgi:hypothetical protein
MIPKNYLIQQQAAHAQWRTFSFVGQKVSVGSDWPRDLRLDIVYTIFNQEVINMEKILISIPDQLAMRMRAAIPSRQRSKIITHLIEAEISRREKTLYDCAVAVEKDRALSKEMKEWDVTLQDGLEDGSW